VARRSRHDAGLGRLLVLLVAAALLGFGADLYIGAGFGSEPRD